MAKENKIKKSELTELEQKRLAEKILRCAAGKSGENWHMLNEFSADLYRTGNSAGGYSHYENRESWYNDGILTFNELPLAPIYVETAEFKSDPEEENDGVWVKLIRVANHEDKNSVYGG